MADDELPIFFPKDLYHRTKSVLKGVFDSFGLEWDFNSKCWIGESGKVIGIFKGHKKPALLKVSGSDAFLNEIKSFAESVGAEIRDAEIKDIRQTREEERIERAKQKEMEERSKAESERLRKESLDNIIRSKIYTMESMGLSKTFMRNWIKMEFKTDVSEMLGIEPVRSTLKKTETRPIPGFVSYVCKIGKHEACGGSACSCECHKET